MRKKLIFIKYLLFITPILSINYVLAEVQISTDVIDVKYPLINDNISSGKTLNKNKIFHGAIDSSDAGSLLNYFVGTDNVSNAGASGIPVIHGFADDRIKVRVDGMDLISGCASHSNSPFSYIDINNISEL